METSTQDASDQAEGVAESGAAEATGGGKTEVIGSDNGVQPEGQEGNAENLENNLPPELADVKKKLFQDYHDKTQKLAAERRELDGKVKDLQQSHDVLSQLMNQEWFKKAYDTEKARRSGQIQEEDLSDEEFQAITQDKRVFREFQKRQAEALESRILSKLNLTQQEINKIKADKEFEDLAKQYPDFKKVNDTGALDDYLKKGYDYETAYARYKLHNGNSKSEIEQEAERILAQRRAAAVEKPGGSTPKGVKVIKAKGLGDALDKLFAAHERGETNVQLEKE